MDDIEKSLSVLEDKEKTSFEEMDKLLDSIDTLINETNNELSDENNKDESKTKDILSKRESELRKLKLIPKVNRICNSYYHKYKELNKKVDENIKGVNYLNNKNLTKFIGNIDEKLIKELIVEHLIRKGNVKTVQRYLEESKLELDTLTKDIMLFQEYYDIINDLNNNKINKLYDWCTKNRDILLKNTGEAITNKSKDENIEENKDIYFECVKYNYILLLEDETKTVEDCVEYTRKHFKPFMSNKYYLKQISKLMTKLMFKKTNKEKSEIITESKIEDKNNNIENKERLEFIKNLFIETFLKLNHKSRDDTLNTVLLAGRYVLPQVVESEEKLAKDKDKKNIEVDKEKNQLMYSLELPEELIFHNIFVCPVSKEIASADNPPIRLNCGHCICKNSFDKIEKSGVRHNQIKCPICTQVGKVDEINKLDII
jgi:hypothetical protein